MWAGWLEWFVRHLALRRLRRAHVDLRRREQRRIEADARQAEHIAHEAAHAGDRVDLARQLFDWAEAFSRTRTAAWAFQSYNCWPLYGWLEVGHGGVLWKRRRRNWFSAHLPDMRMETPEMLAASFTTTELAAALERARRGTFWCDALQIEIANLIWQRGRPV